MPVASAAERGWISSCMGMACGMWGWPPEVFWRATPFDLGLVFEGLGRLRESAGNFGAQDAQQLRTLLDNHKP